MAGAITIQVTGLDKLIKKMGKMPEALVNEVDEAMADVGLEYVGRVVNATPINTGRLKGATDLGRVAPMKYEITNNVFYAPYVEFGTIEFVSVPSELQAYAAQFKGKGILKSGGMPARPFFFSHLPWARTELNVKLNAAVKRVLNK